MVKPLVTKTAQELLDEPLPSMKWLVKELIAPGTTLLVGSPKAGKSWFALELALSISLGLPFLDHETRKGPVLYLALEDKYERVQQRLFTLVDEANNDLDFAIISETLGHGLLAQLEMHFERRPDTALIIIDTLQKVRNVRTSDDAYAVDYDEIGLIKRFADEHDATVVLVHHTRKLGDEANVFNTILGGNGLIGTADEAIMITKRNYFDQDAILSITGRDVDASEHKIRFENCVWTYVEKTSRDEIVERSMPGAVKATVDFMRARGADWEGTPSQLADALDDCDVTASVVGKFLNEYKDFLAERGIEYSRRRTASARFIGLKLIEPPDGKPAE